MINITSNRNSGFTLLELMIVIVIIGFLTSVGISIFNNYNYYQIFKQDFENFVQSLNTAKSNAYSQVKPAETGACTGKELSGYRMRIQKTKYTLYADCNSAQQKIDSASKDFNTITVFPEHTGPPKEIIFQLLTGSVTGNGTYRFSEYGYSKHVTISPVGVITISD
jgi:prepilin-type N-terminal cleavage/methylation domain-containing protein